MKIIKIQQGCQEKKVKNLASDPPILWTENKGETARKKVRFWRVCEWFKLILTIPIILQEADST